jgi:cytochrome c-type biogenesis protein CcsB
VMDYDSYRFFQSSYDKDEKGTILSVNHDHWGTLISYIGYTLLAFGFIITLFNSHSRFMLLRKSIVEIRKRRKSLVATLLLVLGMSSNVFSQQSTIQPAVNAAHADKFGHLITQSVDGRFEPVHSMAYDVLHKVAKKDVFLVDGKGEMDAMQVFMDMIIEPDFWKQQKIIYIKEQSVRDAIGIKTKSASFIDFFDANMKYKLENFANDAFRKKPVEQNNFDKEIIKVDERVNVLMMVFQVSILKIFPEQGAPNAKWLSWDEPAAITPLEGVTAVINEDLKLRVLNYTNITQLYFEEVVKAIKSRDYSRADKVLGYISGIQREGSQSFLPSEKKINAEVFYNKAQIFIFVKNCYGVLSILLLLFTFIDNVRTKKSKIINAMLNFFIAILALVFLYQAFGMGLRAYLLGYAPWSNGYEALVLVSFGTLLAGFSFVRYSKITLAATSLLAFFVLMTAGHSSYDPQLTNLTPVLKSYWLIIHVAVLTISYGFLGLGFILGIINLFIYLFKTKENNERLDLLIFELTFINEMNLTIGLLLATIGTFLGGVWANESWGRYWGWDAKETWALVIVITYTLLLHLRFIPKMAGKLIFNMASVLSYSSVLMTFFGVNYFLSKGMHSYGAGDHAIFPMWAWIAIFCLLGLMLAAKLKEDRVNKIN